MTVFELKSGDFLVVSDAGVRTVVFHKPYAMTGHPGGVPGRLRIIADTIEAAGAATAPLHRPSVCSPA